MKYELWELRAIENALHNEILTMIALQGGPDEMTAYAKNKLSMLEEIRHKVIEHQKLLVC